MWCTVLSRATKFALAEGRVSGVGRAASSYMHRTSPEPLRYNTIGDMLEASASAWPDRPAVRSVFQGTTITYSSLLRQADALGCALRAAGLARGDRLGVWAHNCAEWIVVLAATVRAGIIPVALNPAYEEAELSFCIRQVGMRGIVVAENLKNRDYSSLLTRLIPEVHSSKPGHLNSAAFPQLKIVVSISGDKIPGAFMYGDLIKDYEAVSKTDISKYSSEIQPDDGALIHLTSGTTGQPKAALVSHFSTFNNTYFLGKRITLHHGHEKICVQNPIFHAYGSVITVLGGLTHGATLVLPSATYSPRANVQAMLSEGCTVVHGTPTMYVDAVSLVRAGGERPRLRVALTGGAPCTPQLFRDIQSYLNVESVKSLFGMTEATAAMFQSIDGETMDKVTDTVGVLHDHIEAKVVDENMRTVQFGQPGELLVRGYNVMMGYWGEPEKTRQAIGTDGWLRTGDQFTLSEDGYGRVVGRIKELIIRGGENIPPKEIEDILNTHPDVIESQVFGVSDSRLGEEVCVALRTRNNARLTLEELAKHCRGRLAQYKLPRIIKLVEEFPKTASGKVQKYRLKDMVESGAL